MTVALTVGPWVLSELLAASRRPEFSWAPLRPGVDEHRLHGGTGDGGPTISILRYQAGASVPAHRHHGFEYVHVLAGSQRDGRGTYAAGTLAVNAPGSTHDVISDEGCTVLIIWERPIAFLDDGDGGNAG
jgi:anti-sigma factor ChrR (cupin superfamily)